MNETLDAPVTTETTAPLTNAEPQEPPALSIMDHARTYGPDSDKPDPEAPEGETKAEKAERLHHASLQKRNPSGQFDGKPRIKAKDAVGRINELTGRAKTAEERADALEKELQALKSGQSATSTPRPGASPDASPRPAVPSPQGQPRVPSPQADPEPDENDPKYGGDYGKYMRDLMRWESREALRQHQQQFLRGMEQRRQQAQQSTALQTWAQRVEATRAKYADFDAIAFGPTRIPSGGAIDAFVMEDDNGPEVLYHLQRNPQELESLLTMEHEVRRGGNVTKLLKTLALLSQRFDSPTQGAAGVTGSAPPRITNPPSRPINPVRTEASRAVDGPPPTDGSLGVLAHAKKFRRA